MSNHEPECRAVNEDTPIRTNGCIFCGVARAAYQRGREDADRWCNVAEVAYRKGREDAVQSVGVELLGRYGDLVNSALHEAVSAAARGDGNYQGFLDSSDGAIVMPVKDDLRRFKPLGWYLPEEASVHIHADGTITHEGVVHWFDEGAE